MYPTPYNKVRLGAIGALADRFPDAVVVSATIPWATTPVWPRLPWSAILEKHFTSDKSWPGPDVPISMDPPELRDLVLGSRAIFEALAE